MWSWVGPVYGQVKVTNLIFHFWLKIPKHWSFRPRDSKELVLSGVRRMFWVGGGHKVQNIGASGPGVVSNLKFDLGRDVAL